MQPIITTSRRKSKSTASHSRHPSNVSSPSQDRGRRSKPSGEQRSRSAAPAATVATSLPKPLRPLVLNEPTAECAADYSPPMFAASDVSTSSSGDFGFESASGLPRPGKSNLPLITVIYEGKGGTFYCGADAMQLSIAQTAALAKNYSLRDATNIGQVTKEHKKSDYFLLTQAIGTQNLISCVGVFFLIGTDRFFFAHLYTSKNKIAQGVTDETSEDGKRMAQAVHERLAALALRQDWTSKDVLVKSVVIANGQKPKTTGTPVRNGIAQFLGLKGKDLPDIKPWGAFVVEKGMVAKGFPYMKQIDGYCESGHSNGIRPDVWRYDIDGTWVGTLWD